MATADDWPDIVPNSYAATASPTDEEEREVSLGVDDAVLGTCLIPLLSICRDGESASRAGADKAAKCSIAAPAIALRGSRTVAEAVNLL